MNAREMSLLLWLPVGILGVFVLFVIVQFNKLTSLRLRTSESWSNVDTELKRRHDLIPNLVATVKGYAKHERDLFERVATLRSQALVNKEDSPARLEGERQLAQSLGRLLAVAEGYPQLRASANFLQLQQQLAETEDRIQASRRFYNGNVRDYNNQVQQFPSNLVASWFRFAPHAYFELPNVGERVPPIVQL